jgi:hypothetical protein
LPQTEHRASIAPHARRRTVFLPCRSRDGPFKCLMWSTKALPSAARSRSLPHPGCGRLSCPSNPHGAADPQHAARAALGTGVGSLATVDMEAMLAVLRCQELWLTGGNRVRAHAVWRWQRQRRGPCVWSLAALRQDNACIRRAPLPLATTTAAEALRPASVTRLHLANSHSSHLDWPAGETALRRLAGRAAEPQPRAGRLGLPRPRQVQQLPAVAPACDLRVYTSLASQIN